MNVLSAPGKMVLIGEYAVVDGHEAIVTAVDRRATATLEPAAQFSIRGNGPRRYALGADGLLAGPAGEAPLLRAVVHEALQRHGLDAAPHAHVAISTGAFLGDAGKLGLGSSAAAAVAVAALFVPHRDGGALDIDAIHEVARAGHRRFQGGGSGIDVAAASYGGTLRFVVGERPRPAPPLPTATGVVVAYAGHSVSTQGFVDKYRALPDRRQHAEAMAQAVDGFLSACRADDATALLGAVDAARDVMIRLGTAAGIDVVSDPHRRIAALTAAHGGSAKPSGAGGGDVAVCFVPPELRTALVDALEQAGFAVVPLQIGVAGARIDG